MGPEVCARTMQGTPGSDARSVGVPPLSSTEVPPPSSASGRRVCRLPSWPTVDMAHYNFKKITVVPSAKVSVPGPSVLALFLAGSPEGPPPGPATQATSSKLGVPRVRTDPPAPPKKEGGFLSQTL